MWEDILLFMAVGFAAQLVDGALGMAYGPTGTAVLLSLGVAPATASASVHAAEIVTTGVSGASHWKVGNVRWKLVKNLAIPGLLGGIVGAVILTMIPSDIVRPIVSLYLVVMGGYILWRAFRSTNGDEPEVKWIHAIGAGGGFFDAIGGGGWGPIVNSALLGQGTRARYTIGSVNAAEFFVTLAISATLIGTLGLDMWPIILGLILGGAIAAPIAAIAVKYIPDKPLIIIVGFVIIALSLYSILHTFEIV